MKMAELINRIVPATALLFCTTGCLHDVYYISAKDRSFDSASNFTTRKITADSWVDVREETRSPASYTSSNMVLRERYKSDVIGNLYFDPSAEETGDEFALSIRRANKTYMAEAPLSDPIEIGDKKITPSFAIGRHREQKYMAGIFFRMPF